ncbi:mechanosensitive ion channel family protein [Cellulomonas sp. ATA003]|uniref:mechanosensitive ion channel family protein n=1 Tax=Cellulomonas sp. ATA003 TaxID=3073064 RepID=UPI002872FBF5|nr:mechanosensitive ion channel family protein [Cellulomonas sp. ATA003]WNB85399.1 mechanosensitive ion channel family protein [Cellulomonas sp. ATA003]
MVLPGTLLRRVHASPDDPGLGLDAADLNLPPVEPRQLALGAAVIVVGVLLARALRALTRWWWARRRTPSYARVFSTLVAWGVGVLTAGVGLTIAFPSVRPVDVLGGLGIASVAIGIAFQNVLSNLFAGVLILLREPFRAGDQIAVADVSGTVEEVNLRETVVRTFDGRRVLVPNSTVHGEVLTVQTGYTHIRTTIVVGVDYATDLARARMLILDAVRTVPGVVAEPAPQCLLTELAPSTVNFDVRFWSGARQLEALETRDRVIEAVVTVLTEAGVAMPPDIRLVQPSAELTDLLGDVAQHPSASRSDADADRG